MVKFMNIIFIPAHLVQFSNGLTNHMIETCMNWQSNLLITKHLNDEQLTVSSGTRETGDMNTGAVFKWHLKIECFIHFWFGIQTFHPNLTSESQITKSSIFRCFQFWVSGVWILTVFALD